jgi:hypothetical protein
MEEGYMSEELEHELRFVSFLGSECTFLGSTKGNSIHIMHTQ